MRKFTMRFWEARTLRFVSGGFLLRKVKGVLKYGIFMPNVRSGVLAFFSTPNTYLLIACYRLNNQQRQVNDHHHGTFTASDAHGDTRFMV